MQRLCEIGASALHPLMPLIHNPRESTLWATGCPAASRTRSSGLVIRSGTREPPMPVATGTPKDGDKAVGLPPVPSSDYDTSLLALFILAAALVIPLAVTTVAGVVTGLVARGASVGYGSLIGFGLGVVGSVMSVGGIHTLLGDRPEEHHPVAPCNSPSGTPRLTDHYRRYLPHLEAQWTCLTISQSSGPFSSSVTIRLGSLPL